jgi:hypothetical protein
VLNDDSAAAAAIQPACAEPAQNFASEEPKKRPRQRRRFIGPDETPEGAFTWRNGQERNKLLWIWRGAFCKLFPESARLIRIAWALEGMCRKKGYAWGGDDYLSQELGIRPNHLRAALAAMERAGTIIRAYIFESGKTEPERRIWLSAKYHVGTNSCPDVGQNKPTSGLKLTYVGTKKNAPSANEPNGLRHDLRGESVDESEREPVNADAAASPSVIPSIPTPTTNTTSLEAKRPAKGEDVEIPTTATNTIPLEAKNATTSQDADYYRRVEEVCGAKSSSLGRKLLAAKGGSVALARAVVETASTKHDPREYIGAIIRKTPADDEAAGSGSAADLKRRLKELVGAAAFDVEKRMLEVWRSTAAAREVVEEAATKADPLMHIERCISIRRSII